VVAEIPDTIVLKRDRDLARRSKELWGRRALLLLITAFVIAAFANVFGQRSSTSEIRGPAATLAVHSPAALRSGLVFQSRLRITAARDLKDVIVVLSPSWLEGVTLNTLEPSPVGEASRNGSISLDLGHIPQGQTYSLYLQRQVNPTTFGTRTEETQVFDGDSLLLTSRRDVTIFP
jgi:hypothetical protein